MSCRIKEIERMTIVQVKVPVCVTIQMDEAEAKEMTMSELRELVDDILEIGSWDVDTLGGMNYCIDPHWDELPADEMEITMVDEGLFEQ